MEGIHWAMVTKELMKMCMTILGPSTVTVTHYHASRLRAAYSESVVTVLLTTVT